MEVYEERFCESRDFGCKMWGADCVYYGLKESILDKDNDLRKLSIVNETPISKTNNLNTLNNLKVTIGALKLVSRIIPAATRSGT